MQIQSLHTSPSSEESERLLHIMVGAVKCLVTLVVRLGYQVFMGGVLLLISFVQCMANERTSVVQLLKL